MHMKLTNNLDVNICKAMCEMETLNMFRDNMNWNCKICEWNCKETKYEIKISQAKWPQPAGVQNFIEK